MSAEGLTGFFDVLAGSLAKAGHPGIRAAQFEDLGGLLARYERLTGSPPDERTADYIAGRVRDGRGVRNVVGFARRIAEDVLRTGEGFVAGLAREPPPAPLPGSSSEPYSAPEPPDWKLLHLAHVEQVSPAGEVWASVLEVLRSQVPRPAFETWLAESRGLAYADGQFVVSAPSRFAAEMLEARTHPLIERALRDVTGKEISIGYAVMFRGDEPCPRCEAGTRGPRLPESSVQAGSSSSVTAISKCAGRPSTRFRNRNMEVSVIGSASRSCGGGAKRKLREYMFRKSNKRHQRARGRARDLCCSG